MAYERLGLKDFDTANPFAAKHVEHIEDGIVQNESDITTLNADLTDFKNVQRINTYRTLGDIGLSSPTTTIDILNQMRTNGYLSSELYFFGGTSSITDLPRGDGVLHIVMGNSTSSRFYVAEYSCNNASGVAYYRGYVGSSWSSLTWYLMSATEVSTTSLQNDELEPI